MFDRNLPVMYNALKWYERKEVRDQYTRVQGGLCQHCKDPLAGPPAPRIAKKKVIAGMFPTGFFNHPVHLHHNHRTGLTIGAVHAHCNAVLAQYHGI